MAASLQGNLIACADQIHISGLTDVLVEIYEVDTGVLVHTESAAEINTTGVYFIYWTKLSKFKDYLVMFSTEVGGWKVATLLETK